MAVASEQHDGEFFSQLGRMRQAMNRSASAAKRLADGDRSAEVMNDLNVGEIVRRDARGRLQDAASSRAGARGNALLQAAAELNPFGKPYPDFAHPWTAGPANASDSREVKRLADGPVSNLLPASWLTFSARHTPIRAELVEIDPALVNFAVLPEDLSIGGGYARAGTPYARHYTGAPDTAYLEIVTGVRTTERGRIRLVLHEICHRVEDAVPGLIEHEREHHRQRVPGAWDPEMGEPLAQFNREDAAPDASPPFFDDYLKQRLTPRPDTVEGYEILSMSVENLFFGPRSETSTDLSTDPTTERFVLSLLLG